MKNFVFFQSCELSSTTTWVIADHVNSPGCPGDLTVSRGQQVEVLDIPSPTTALVRLVPPNISSTTNSAFAKSISSPSSNNAGGISDSTTNNQSSSQNEGTLPISCLKQPPGGFRSQHDIAGNILNNEHDTL